MDALMRRIEEAQKYAPMDRLGICPQCGFSSAAMSKFAILPSKVTIDIQTLKINRLVEAGLRRGGTHEAGCEPGARVRIAIGLFTAAAIQDPYPYYREMRERDPVHWSEIAQAWYFTRYKDVFELQDRPDLSVDRIETIYSYLPSVNAGRFSDIVDHYNRWLLYRDDAYHDRLKALFIRAMTPRAVERLRPMIQQRVDSLLDTLAQQPAFDAYLDFAARIPTQVMLDLLGLPDSDEAMMRQWSDRCSNFLFQPVAPDKEAMAQEQRDILDAQQKLFHAGDRGAPRQARRRHDQRHGAGRRQRRPADRSRNSCDLQYDGDGGRRHLAQCDRHGAMAAASVSRRACQADEQIRT